MSYFKITLLSCCIVCLISCDHTMYVAVRNYREPSKVNVIYEKSGNTFFDSDTLFLKPIGNSKFDSSLLRVNTSPGSYSFTAPYKKEIALKPISFGQPIKQVDIINSPGSPLKINLWNRKEFKKLKKAGKIKTKGFILTTSIVIENK